MLFTAKEIETMLKGKEIVKEGLVVCIYGTTLLFHDMDKDEFWLSVSETEENNVNQEER